MRSLSLSNTCFDALNNLTTIRVGVGVGGGKSSGPRPFLLLLLRKNIPTIQG